VERNEAKIETLNERLLAKEKLGTQNVKTTSRQVRKSLDSTTFSSRAQATPPAQQNVSTPHNTRNHSGGLFLGDFIVKSTSGGKKSKGKNRNRKSDSALLNIKSDTGLSPSTPILGLKEIEDLESSPLTDSVPTTNINHHPKEVLKKSTPSKKPSKESKVSTTPSSCKTPSNIKFHLEEKPEEVFSPLKRFIRFHSFYFKPS